MPRINYGISNHPVPSRLGCAHITNPHTHAGNLDYNPSISRPFWPHRYRLDAIRVQLINTACDWIRNNVIGSTATRNSCNTSFSALPGGQSFQSIWRSNRIWISCCMCPGGLFGIRHGTDIAIAAGAYRAGWEAVAATIIHELAHVNGAPGNTSAAEDTLLSCGLSSQHIPGLIGRYLREAPQRVARVA